MLRGDTLSVVIVMDTDDCVMITCATIGLDWYGTIELSVGVLDDSDKDCVGIFSGSCYEVGMFRRSGG